MSGGDYRSRPSIHIPGKGFLIVIVIVFSSLSFTLGYFVGKSTKGATPEPPVPVAEPASPGTGQGSSDVQPRADAAKSDEDYGPDGLAAGSPEDGGRPPLPKGETVYKPLSGETPDGGHAERTADAVKPSPSKGNLQRGTIFYTVQIGALSNQKDAEDLRVKYDKKGYKAYVVPARNKRGDAIYKVRIGEFSNRKNADILSLRLRKIEGLNTFVTFKDE